MKLLVTRTQQEVRGVVKVIRMSLRGSEMRSIGTEKWGAGL